ncbi:SH3 domain-containing protein [uncultured Arcticibacterium sp.]|uniref:SH3 domain-containing protein n=1 Tax=uncultured Arcticibacterium sp. TaxID=2173042 RepID=UPI0030F7295C
MIQALDIQSQDLFQKKADSLFSEKKYSEASDLYLELLDKHSINRSNAYLKLAFISEQKGDFSKAIYFLSEYFNLNPSESTFTKINKMAEENSFIGYGRSDFNFLLLVYERFYLWICLVLFLIVGFSFYLLLLKKIKREPTALRHKVSFVFLVLFSLLFLNFGDYYSQGIVKSETVYVRQAPSSASKVIGNLGEGSRVNVIGEKDIWLRLLINGEIQFAKKSDFWIID